MPKIPIITGEKLIKVLKKKGFILNRIKGSHYIFVFPSQKLLISVPVHKGQTLGRGITLGILKDAGITPEEFFKLL